MANRKPKGVEYMRTLALKGGYASGKTRRENRFNEEMCTLAGARGLGVGFLRLPELVRKSGLFRPNYSGGSHDMDWRCPACRHFNNIQRRACAKCKEPGPMNGRITRAALRELEAEHRTRAILDKHGL